ncbi:MAG TPA: hypothetical protein VEG27_05640 [Usitatibacter sp.]|nr:hypothetical protein [Usitatibacter sp.]
MRALAAALPIALLLASGTARPEDRVAALGKERAAASILEWDIREAGHPVLGPVRFAHLKLPIATSVGDTRVYSNAYVSCALNDRTIGIELTNQVAPDDPGGLPPKAPPRLVCKRPAAGSGAGTAQDLIEARWQYNDFGDALARGLRPSTLRACSSIGIVEEVVLPKGWARPTASIAFEITPYARALDSIFATCGAASAYASGAVASASARPAAPATAAAAPPAAAPAWRTARTVAGGHTNVRAAPSVHSAIVIRLDPGALVLVEPAGGVWWRAKSRGGTRFEGFIREDRLVLK